MIGGMVSSTILTLAVIPAIFALVERARMRISRPKAEVSVPVPT